MTKMKFSCARPTITGKSYVPPVISNGVLCTQIDYCGEQKQKDYFQMIPGIYMAGRRFPGQREGNLFPFGYLASDECNEAIDWEESLDCENALLETKCQYSANKMIASRVFVAAQHNILAFHKSLSGIDSYRLNYVFGITPGQDPCYGKFTIKTNKNLVQCKTKKFAF